MSPRFSSLQVSTPPLFTIHPTALRLLQALVLTAVALHLCATTIIVCSLTAYETLQISNRHQERTQPDLPEFTRLACRQGGTYDEHRLMRILFLHLTALKGDNPCHDHRPSVLKRFFDISCQAAFFDRYTQTSPGRTALRINRHLKKALDKSQPTQYEWPHERQ